MIDAEDVCNAVLYVVKMILFMFIVNIVFYYLGFIILKIVTLWRYPPVDMTDRDRKIVVNIGGAAPLFVLFCFFIVNNYVV